MTTIAEEEFEVYSEGIIYASVCSSLAQAEVEKRMALRLCGAREGWKLSQRKFSGGEDNPTSCGLKPETHKHYLFSC